MHQVEFAEAQLLPLGQAQLAVVRQEGQVVLLEAPLEQSHNGHTQHREFLKAEGQLGKRYDVLLANVHQDLSKLDSIY